MKTILFVQGLGMTKHEANNSFDEIAARLQQAGFQPIQVNLLTDEHELSLHERAKKVEELAAECKPDGIVAQSYGATTVLSASLPTVKSQVFISPGLSMMNTIRQVFESRGVTINFNGDTSLPRSTGDITMVGKEFWTDLKHFDDVAHAKKVKIPTCIFHGDQDMKIPVDTVQTFFNAIPVINNKLKIFVGGDHGIVDVPRPMREEFLQDIVAWFKETLI